jgi:hypothetical protein
VVDTGDAHGSWAGRESAATGPAASSTGGANSTSLHRLPTARRLEVAGYTRETHRGGLKAVRLGGLP